MIRGMVRYFEMEAHAAKTAMELAVTDITREYCLDRYNRAKDIQQRVTEYATKYVGGSYDNR